MSGVEVRDVQGNTVDVDSGEAQAGLAAGRFELANDEVRVIGPDNRTAYFKRSDVPDALAQGWRIASEGEAQAAKVRREASSVGGTVRGGVEAAARGASVGLSDVVAQAFGADVEGMRARQEALGEAGTVVETAGAVAASIATGGAGAAAQGARAGLLARTLGGAGRAIAAPTRAVAGVAGAAERAVLGGARQSLARRVAATSVEGAVDGALGGLGGAVSESVLQDKELTAEAVLGSVMAGAAFGGGLQGTASLGAGGLGRLLRGVEATRGGSVSNSALRDVVARDVGVPADALPDGLVEAAGSTDVGMLGSVVDRLAPLSGADPAKWKRVLAKVQEDPQKWRQVFNNRGEIEREVAGTFQDGLTQVRRALDDARMVSGGEAKYKSLSGRMPQNADYVAPRLTEQRIRELEVRLEDMERENLSTNARSYDPGVLRETRRLLGRADVEVRGGIRDDYVPPARLGDEAAVNVLEEKNIVGPLARVERVGDGRSLDAARRAYKNATPQEIADIAAGRTRAKTGKVLEPIKVVDNGPDHAEFNMPRYTIRSGLQEIAAAQEAGARRINAQVYIANEAGEEIMASGLVRIDDATTSSAGGSFRALDRLKRDLGEQIRATGGWGGPAPGSTTDVQAANKALREMYGEIKDHLERDDLFGEAATAQAEINKAYSRVAEAESAFRTNAAPGLKRLLQGDGTVSARQAITLARQYGRMGGDEVVQQLDDALQAQLDYLRAVQKHYDVGDVPAQVKAAEDAISEVRRRFESQREIAEFLDDAESLRESESNRSVSMGIMSSVGPSVGALAGAAVAGPVGAAVGVLAGAVTRPYTTARSMASLLSVTGSFGRKFDGQRLVSRLRARLRTPARGLRAAAARAGEQARAAGRGGVRAAAFQIGKGDDRAKKAQQLAKRVQEMSSPDGLKRALGPEHEVLALDAPETAAAIETSVQRAAMFLQSKQPNIEVNPYSGHVTINPREVDRWLRYRGAIVNPRGVIGRVLDGTVTYEDIEALAAVYPRHLEGLQQGITDAMAVATDRGNPVPYDGRLRLGRVLNVPLDAAHLPERIAAAQARMRPPQQQQQGQQGQGGPKVRAAGVKELDLGRRQTHAQGLLT